MISLPAGTGIWITAGVTDVRRGFTGLSAAAQTVLEQNPYSGHVFVFRGKRGDLIKLLTRSAESGMNTYELMRRAGHADYALCPYGRPTNCGGRSDPPKFPPQADFTSLQDGKKVS